MKMFRESLRMLQIDFVSLVRNLLSFLMFGMEKGAA